LSDKTWAVVSVYNFIKFVRNYFPVNYQSKNFIYMKPTTWGVPKIIVNGHQDHATSQNKDLGAHWNSAVAKCD
jgi:hypothetical protein